MIEAFTGEKRLSGLRLDLVHRDRGTEYATNGHLLVWRPCEATDTTPNGLPKVPEWIAAARDAFKAAKVGRLVSVGDNVRHACGNCGGSKRAPSARECATCSGRGEHECDDCGGLHHCFKCRGEGKICDGPVGACKACSGSGFDSDWIGWSEICGLCFGTKELARIVGVLGPCRIAVARHEVGRDKAVLLFGAEATDAMGLLLPLWTNPAEMGKDDAIPCEIEWGVPA